LLMRWSFASFDCVQVLRRVHEKSTQKSYQNNSAKLLIFN